jgi:sirohydrochlorin ferrochelatase
MNEPTILLVDNGSTRAAATLNLRDIAGALSRRVGRDVHPVSLQHADRVPPTELDGRPALVLPDFLAERLAAGERSFVTVPLFFGRSRALTSFIPEQVERLGARFGPFEIAQADVLFPLPDGEPRLVEIVADQAATALGGPRGRVILVDHGSPLPAVTAVREAVAAGLRARLPADVTLDQAVMERRSGSEYDFNGDLLEERLDAAASDGECDVALAMLFLSPGRHAGPGGDIETICADAMARHPALRVRIAPLVGEHPGLVDILADRLAAVTAPDRSYPGHSYL